MSRRTNTLPVARLLRRWRPLAVAAALVLAGCGGQTGEATLVVMEAGTYYAPAAVTIPAGGTVIWRNMDRLAHTVTGEAQVATDSFRLEAALPAGAAPFDSGDLFAGHTWQHTFETAGTYVYFCRYHAGEQMLGTVVVE